MGNILFLLDFDRHSSSCFRLDRFASGRDCRSRHRGGQTYGLSVLQVSIDGSNHYTGFNRDQVDTHQRNSDPSVDHDALVEDTIEDVYKTSSAWRSFYSHCASVPLFKLLTSVREV